MFFELDSREHQEQEINSFPPSRTLNLPQNNISPMRNRQANIERLDLKSLIAYEKSSTSDSSPTLASSLEDPQKDLLRMNENKEIKIYSGPQSIYSVETGSVIKHEEPNTIHQGSLNQHPLFRTYEDPSESPKHQKQNVAPLEFSIVVGPNLLSNQREEYGFDSHSHLSIKKIKSQSRLSTDYKILEVLGKGSFGKVYKCVSNLDKNEYAIKEMLRKFTGRYKLYSQGETKMMALITGIDDNAHLVRYYHAWVESEKLFLVMEYCPSSLSKERKQKGILQEHDLKKILRDMCVGLQFLHKNDIVHLDVKPENILVSSTGKYKLADMGQAKNLNDKTSTDLGEGDCRYLSHEALNTSKSALDYTKIDIFSLGMTLFELATNKELPKNGDEWHNLRKGDFQALDQVTHLSESFKNLIKLMIDQDPVKRPSAKDLLDQYLVSREELELKWQEIMRKKLENEQEVLIKQVHKNERRRKTIC